MRNNVSLPGIQTLSEADVCVCVWGGMCCCSCTSTLKQVGFNWNKTEGAKRRTCWYKKIKKEAVEQEKIQFDVAVKHDLQALLYQTLI